MTTENIDTTTETRILIGRDGGFIDNTVFRNRPHIFAGTINAKTAMEFAMSPVRTGATEAEALKAFAKQFPKHEPQYVYTITRKLVQKPDLKALAEKQDADFQMAKGLKTILDNLEKSPPPVNPVSFAPTVAPTPQPTAKPAHKPRKNPRRPKYAYRIVQDAMDRFRTTRQSSFDAFDVEGKLAVASVDLDAKLKVDTTTDWKRANEVVKTTLGERFANKGPHSKEAMLDVLSAALRKLR